MAARDEVYGEPLPCPLCQSDEHLETVDWHDDDGRWLAVECRACKVTTPIGTWNLLPRAATETTA